ncbi:MAG: NnrU family protein [Candidatus Thorarchaeota archaeon]|nr:NnrU family protein [Candidatus Thorarchaeota archaeon]
MLEYLPIVLGTIVFGLQHSGISALSVKGRIIDKWGKEGYSRIFTITSIIGILLPFLAMWYWDWLYFLFDPSAIQPLLFISGIILGALGGWVTVAATKVISVSTVADMRTDRMPELITDGIYSRMRHPLYLATILLLLALALIYPFPQIAVFSLSLGAYTMVGAYFEERKLILHYGDEYLEYRNRAGFILPKI